MLKTSTGLKLAVFRKPFQGVPLSWLEDLQLRTTARSSVFTLQGRRKATQLVSMNGAGNGVKWGRETASQWQVRAMGYAPWQRARFVDMIHLRNTVFVGITWFLPTPVPTPPPPRIKQSKIQSCPYQLPQRYDLGMYRYVSWSLHTKGLRWPSWNFSCRHSWNGRRENGEEWERGRKQVENMQQSMRKQKGEHMEGKGTALVRTYRDTCL